MVLSALGKICNHPALYKAGEGAGQEEAEQAASAAGAAAPAPFDPSASGKMAALDVLLRESLGAGDRMVVVSQSTTALDLVQVGGPGRGGGLCCWAAGDVLGRC